MPGQSSSDLHDLSPRFKRKVEKLIINLTQNGYSIRVSQTFRDQERQQFLHDVSIKMKKFLGKDIKITTTTKSRHSHKIDSKPAACAIDIRPNHVYLPGSQVEFYKTMRDEAKKLGLRSGADFKRTSTLHKKYDIGWDPGHIYATKCI